MVGHLLSLKASRILAITMYGTLAPWAHGHLEDARGPVCLCVCYVYAVAYAVALASTLHETPRQHIELWTS